MNKPIFYWDACVFIADLKEEQIIKGGLEGIKEIEKLVNKKEATIVTSVLTFTEILQSELPIGKFEQFQKLFWRPNINAHDIDESIAKLAGEIRNFYNKDKLKKISTPDAIHLATAINLGVDVLHTFDGCGKDSGLLQYNGNIADKYTLKIEPPLEEQLSLLSYKKNEEDQEK